MVPVKKVVTRGYRKCQHFVKIHHLKTNAPIKAQEDNQEVNTCLVKIGVLRNLSLRYQVLPFIGQTDINYQLLESAKKNTL